MAVAGISSGKTSMTLKELLSKFFFSSDEPRLRAGWRLALQTMIMVFSGSCLSIPVMFYFIVSGMLTSNLNLNNISKEILLPLQIVELMMVTASVYLARRFLDKRSFTSLGLSNNPPAILDILAGIFIAAFIMALIFAIEFKTGWVKFEGFAWELDSVKTVITNSILFLIIFSMVGWNEELLSRGYHLQTLVSGTNMFWGVVISSSVFGLAHLGNPNATWVSAAGIFLAGLFFAYSYLRTGQLWLAIGLHIGWNFFEGVIFGFPISGLDIYRLIRHQIQGPEIWTGGAFGPEAGLIVLPALIIGTALIYLYTQNRKIAE
jgi:membrane protease YdiL (CAAX protease family)